MTSIPTDLTTKKETDDIPYAIFDGDSLFIIRVNKIVQFFQMLWRYGFGIFRINSFLTGLLKKFRTIYTLQENGMAYANVEDMFQAVGGQEMSDLMKVSARDYMLNELCWNERVVDELVVAALRANYGQSTSINAFVASVALAGSQDGSLWRVVGGNYKIAESVLKESEYSSLVMEDVVSVTKTEEEDGSVKYTVATADGNFDHGYDVVVVANPLNTSSVKYNNFSSDVYTEAATTPYQQTVAAFYKGKINQQFFGKSADFSNFPQFILTTDMESPPFNFIAVNVEVPSDVEQDEVPKYEAPLHDDPIRVWKVCSPQPLTRDQCLSLFPETNPDDSVCCNWLAYPRYIAPYRAASFILDEGVFYINAIEMAASAMEMSAIGAKNAALLARDYLIKIHGTNHSN
jgi:prenylcysteine oxidase/farnesylcysteine lyase